MTTTCALLHYLADGLWHGGPALADQLGCTRATIAQQIKKLQRQGIVIQVHAQQGYCITGGWSVLHDKVIGQQWQLLSNKYNFIDQPPLHVLYEVDSTNQWLWQQTGGSELVTHNNNTMELTQGTLCVAEQQHAGRGRRGREWCSPLARNLYVSYYGHLSGDVGQLSGLSLVVGVIIAEVLRDEYGLQVQLKWPNDLYVGAAKLGGILVELRGSTYGLVEYVVGFGINVNQGEGSLLAVAQAWTSMQLAAESPLHYDRNSLLARLWYALHANITVFHQRGLSAFLARYRELDILAQQPVTIDAGDRCWHGIAQGITEQGGLLVCDEQGVQREVIAGEVSVRLGACPE